MVLISVKRLPVFELKIDLDFVSEIERYDSDQAMVKTVLSMAKLFYFVRWRWRWRWRRGGETAGQFVFIAAPAAQQQAV